MVDGRIIRTLVHSYDVSEEIDNLISQEVLVAWGVKIDTLTPEQTSYLNSWQV